MAKAFGSWRRYIIAILLALFILLYLAASQAPDYLSSLMSQKFKVPVQIGNIHFTPFSIQLNKLHIGNPPGSRLAEAFSCQTIQSEAMLYEYLKEHTVIDLIILDDVYLGLEFDTARGTHGNWSILMSNLKAQEKQTTSKASNRSLLIKKVIVKNIKTDVLYRDSNSGPTRLPTIDEIEFTNITSEGGFPMDQLMDSVLGKMLESVFIKQNLKDMLNNLLDQAPSQLDGLIRPFKGWLNANDRNGKEEKAV